MWLEPRGVENLSLSEPNEYVNLDISCRKRRLAKVSRARLTGSFEALVIGRHRGFPNLGAVSASRH
jgi:hypothetical protein